MPRYSRVFVTTTKYTNTCIKSIPSLLGEIIRNLVDKWMRGKQLLGSIITRRSLCSAG
jgi:hypothetical protein